MEKINNKRFPANNKKQLDLPIGANLTFLNDKKIDAELYAYYQSISTPAKDQPGIVNPKKPDEKIYPTRVLTKDICSQTKLCEALGHYNKDGKWINMDPKTHNQHLSYLIQQKYMIEEQIEFITTKSGKSKKKVISYILPIIEDYYLMIPIETVNYLRDTVKDPVFKTYILLGTMWNWKGDQYTFDLGEIAEHLGYNSNEVRNLSMVNHYLIALKNNGLIDYVDYYKNINDNLGYPQKRLTSFNLSYKK